MKLSDFQYHLPEHLIAKYPLSTRSDSRLLCLDEVPRHMQFCQLDQLLNPSDILVFNNTKVVPARFFGKKETGGQCEFLLERVVEGGKAWLHIRASKSPKVGSRVVVKDHEAAVYVKILARDQGLFLAQLDHPQGVDWLAFLARVGTMPLPPYIERAVEDDDERRYQTVYAKTPGAVAAPTAGLHFDQALLERLADKKVDFAHITLHVGAGTFQPVRVDNIEQHKMHREWLQVPQDVVDKVNHARQTGGRVVAVGTTSVRALETAAQQGVLAPYQGDTEIFIRPGYQFKAVDALITNFHLPESTLLMLVSAFAGYQEIMAAYQCAVEHQYRFFSYGDAMFIPRVKPGVTAGQVTGRVP